MNTTALVNELIDERARLKERLRRVESALRSVEQLCDTVGAPSPVLRGTTMRERILSLLESQPASWMKPKTIAALIGHDNNVTVGQCLSALRRSNEVAYSRPHGYRQLGPTAVSLATAE